MFFGESGLEIGGGEVEGSAFVLSPLHEEAVAQAAHHSQHPDAIFMAHPAEVVVVGDIQALVQTTFDVPGLTVEAQPVLRIEARGLGAGDQGHLFVFAPGALAQEPGSLSDQRKADLLTTDCLGENAAAFLAAFIDFQGARRMGRRLLRGENRPPGRRGVFRSALAR